MPARASIFAGWCRAMVALSVSASAAQVGDNSLGTWHLNVAKSEYSPASFPFKALTMTRTAVEGGVKVTLKGERSDGIAIDATYTAKYDGTEAAVSGKSLPYDRISLRRLSADVFTAEATARQGRFHSSDKAAVTNGGTRLTVISSGIQADGNEFAATFLFEKE